MLYSYNGWPALYSGPDSKPKADYSHPQLTRITPVAGRTFPVRKGATATIFDWLIRRFHAEVEPVDAGALDDWGYAFRAVRAGASLSNHSSGTAVDLNATRHPFNTSAARNFTPAQIAAVRRILADTVVDGVQIIRWLDGHDPMHFELNRRSSGATPERVQRLAERLGGHVLSATPAPVVPAAGQAAADVEPREPRMIDWRNFDPAYIRIVQEAIGAGVDGARGPETNRKVAAAQRRWGLSPDGIPGADFARAYLLSVPNLYRSKPDADMPDAAVKLLHWLVGLPIDASFGPGLEAAMKGVQVWAGINPVDGNVGADTKRRIIR